MKSVYMPVRIEPQLYDEVERIANEGDTTISAVVREAVRQFIAGYQSTAVRYPEPVETLQPLE